MLLGALSTVGLIAIFRRLIIVLSLLSRQEERPGEFSGGNVRLRGHSTHLGRIEVHIDL